MALEWCEPCGRTTPHTNRRECKPCRSKASRAVKRSRVGHPLVRYGDLLKAADDMWSVWVRAKEDACEMCRVWFHPASMQCAHGISREDHPIRFDPANTYALCAACHRRHTPARTPWWDWMRAHVPADYDRLEMVSRARGKKLRASDLQLVTLDAQQRIAALPEGPRKDWALERTAKIQERMVRLGVRAA